MYGKDHDYELFQRVLLDSAGEQREDNAEFTAACALLGVTPVYGDPTGGALEQHLRRRRQRGREADRLEGAEKHQLTSNRTSLQHPELRAPCPRPGAGRRGPEEGLPLGRYVREAAAI